MCHYADVSDEGLLSRYLENDRDAFQSLAKQWFERLDRLASVWGMRSASDREDVIQLTMLHVAQYAHRFTRCRRFAPWITRIHHNNVNTWHRRSRHRPGNFSDLGWNQDPNVPGWDPADESTAKGRKAIELLVAVRESLVAESESSTTAFRQLRVFDALLSLGEFDISMDVLAAQLEIPRATFWRDLKHIRNRLREIAAAKE